MHGQRFRGQGSVCIAITVRHALCVSTQSEHNCDAARFTYEDYQSPKTFWLFKCHQVLGPLQPFYPELTWICKSARSRSTRGTSFTLRGLSTLVYTVCGLQRDLVARSRTPAGMVPLSARRVPDRSTGPPTLALSGTQGRAGPFRVRTPYRGRRVALKRAGGGSVRGDGAEAQPAAGSSLSGEPSQGAVGAPLADAIGRRSPTRAVSRPRLGLRAARSRCRTRSWSPSCPRIIRRWALSLSRLAWARWSARGRCDTQGLLSCASSVKLAAASRWLVRLLWQVMNVSTPMIVSPHGRRYLWTGQA